jgi:hypothetical protein
MPHTATCAEVGEYAYLLAFVARCGVCAPSGMLLFMVGAGGDDEEEDDARDIFGE